MRAHRGIVLLALAMLGALAGVAYHERDALRRYLGRPDGMATIVLSGNIEAHQSVIGFKTVQSRITELPFDEGQAVTAGTLVARVDDADYRQQVAIAAATLEGQRRQLAATQQDLAAAAKLVESDTANLAFAQSEYDRAKTLMEKGVGTIEARDRTQAALLVATAARDRDDALREVASRQVDLAEANIATAEEQLKLAQITLGYTTLTAPIDGVITVREAELGEIVVPGTPVLTIADLDHVWLRAYINEPDIGKVRLGQSATVTTDTYPNTTYAGRVAFISPVAEFTPKTVETHAERVTLVYRVRIDIANASHALLPGMPADARLDALPPAAP
ncbi:efflux RND transporter periplasmic adaptor subunit [Acuticoccus sp. M5D2P5]|uniref:HlyD family secretion protein n=1 Tax=Acuticoccus kalidii TaxID=2910977 RepID=UPI001F1B32E7|nr:efflux RND transporter periplasmic adaptor subunit [Acuticoccus kalidii]MCF3933742.1 efflux RND transporter periplasmic adaptor subunit [Acuticoccus kalidii]